MQTSLISVFLLKADTYTCTHVHTHSTCVHTLMSTHTHTHVHTHTHTAKQRDSTIIYSTKNYQASQDDAFSFSFWLFVCYTCVFAGTCIPQHVCGDWRTTSGVNPCLLPCLRQGPLLFFTAVSVRLAQANPGASRESSSLCLPRHHRNTGNR